MAADSYDVTIDQGADWLWTVRWLVGKNRRSATPKDVTGYHAVLVIARATPLLMLTDSNGGVTIVPDEGAFGFRATAVQTDSLPVGKRLKYEVRVTSPDTIVKRLAYGYVTVKPSVT